MKTFLPRVILCHFAITQPTCVRLTIWKKCLPICLCPLKHKFRKFQFYSLKLHVTILNNKNISFFNPSISIQVIFVQPIKLNKTTRYKSVIFSKSLNKSPLIYQFKLGISVTYPMNVFSFWQLTTKNSDFLSELTDIIPFIFWIYTSTKGITKTCFFGDF